MIQMVWTIVVFFALALNAESSEFTNRYDELVTIHGDTYKNVRPKRLEDDSIVIFHSAGIKKIPVSILPTNVIADLALDSQGQDREQHGSSQRDGFYAWKHIGKIPGQHSESLSGKTLYALVKTKPKSTVYVVTGELSVNENGRDYNKYFFDKTKKLLVFMRHTVMPRIGEDFFVWRIWHDVSLNHFKDGLPYSNQELKTTPSPSHNPRANFPIKYPKHSKITEWPGPHSKAPARSVRKKPSPETRTVPKQRYAVKNLIVKKVKGGWLKGAYDYWLDVHNMTSSHFSGTLHVQPINSSTDNIQPAAQQFDVSVRAGLHRQVKMNSAVAPASLGTHGEYGIRAFNVELKDQDGNTVFTDKVSTTSKFEDTNRY